MIDDTVPSDKPLGVRKNLLGRIQKVIMTTEDKVRDEKLQYNINKKAEKISALSSGKIGKYEYHTGEKMLPSDQGIVIEQAKFTCCSLEKQNFL